MNMVWNILWRNGIIIEWNTREIGFGLSVGMTSVPNTDKIKILEKYDI